MGVAPAPTKLRLVSPSHVAIEAFVPQGFSHGIYVEHHDCVPPTQGIVRAVGSPNPGGHRISVGDHVLFQRYAGEVIRTYDDRTTLVVMDADDVAGVVEYADTADTADTHGSSNPGEEVPRHGEERTE